MDITHKISLDLQQTGARQVMFAKQGDCLTRIARLLLYDGGTEFSVPDGVTPQIAYAKPDGKGGIYDTMPDGSAACTVSGNVVTARLHPQMFSVAGIVACELRLLTASGAQLSTFSWFITVQASATEGIVSEDYFNVASLEGLQAAIGDLTNLSTEAKDSLVAAINEVLGKITAGGVTSVAGKTGDVTLDAGDIAAEIDGTEVETVADALVALLVAIGDLDELSTDAKDSLVAAINEVLGKIPKSVVTSVNGKTGEVTLDAGDIALHAALSDDLPAKSTVQAALEYLLNKLQNVSITPADGVYVVVENEDDAAVMRKLAAKAEELRQGYETGVGNVAVPIINTEDSAEGVSAAHIVRSDAEKEAAVGDVEIPSVGRVGEMIAENTPTVDEAAIQEAVKDVAVTGMNITRGSGHYTATWKDAGTEKSANIVGGAGLAQVTEILSYVSDTGLPKLHKSKLVGAPMYSVMIGDLIVYTGADYIGSVWSAEAGANVEQTVAAKNEVFRVVTVTDSGKDNEGYIVERTGLILPDIGVTDRRAEWLAWLLAEDGQTSDADVSMDEVFRFLRSLPSGLHYINNPGCWGEFWSVNQSGLDGTNRCVVFAPPDIYIASGGTVLKLSIDGTLKKSTDNGETFAKSVDLLNAIPPKPTSADAGKVLTVAADGSLVWA